MLRAVLVVLLAAVVTSAQEEPVKPAEDASTPDYRKALNLLRRGRFKLAQKTLRRLLKQYPESVHLRDAMDRSDDNCYLGTDVLWKSGPSERRIDVAVMGDGFTIDRSTQSKQEKWAKLCVDVLWNEKAFSQYRTYFNIYFVRLASLEEGVDPQLSPEQRKKIEEKNRYRSRSRQKKTDFSTALDAKAAGPQGQVMMDRRLVYRWLEVANRDVAGVGSDRYVIAFAQFGRLGMGGGGIANVGRPDKSVTTHEFGHAFSRLLDEYAINPNPPEGMWGRMIKAANAHRSDEEPKPEDVPWAHLLKKRVKGVGIYEGGATYKKGVWRPAASCAMNSAGATGFCPVCREQTVLVIYEHIDPIEQALPAPGELEITQGDEKFLTVTPIEPYRHKLDVTWHIASHAVTKRESERPVADEGAGDAGTGADPAEAPDNPFGITVTGGGDRPGGMGFGGTRGNADRSVYDRPPPGKESRWAKSVRAKGRGDQRVPPHSVFPLERLEPGLWRITCQVEDRTKWVVKDEKHLLQERVSWFVTVRPAAEDAPDQPAK